MGLFEPKWLIRLASCFMIAFSGSLWVCRWFCHNCNSASFSALFLNKCIVISIPLSTGCEFRGFLIWCRLWSAALHFQDVLPSRPVLVIKVSNHNITSYPLNQSLSSSRWLIQQCPDSKLMDFESLFVETHMQALQGMWKNQPRGLHAGDKQYTWNKRHTKVTASCFQIPSLCMIGRFMPNVCYSKNDRYSLVLYPYTLRIWYHH